MSQIDLSIIIVNHNTRDLLLDCLRTVREETRRHKCEIFVVDNASSDGSADAVAEEYPDVRLCRNMVNVGFSPGNNMVLSQCCGRHVLLLNPDTVILDDALGRMIDFLDAQPEYGVVGPKMYHDASMRPWRYETWTLTPLRYLAGPLLRKLRGDVGDGEVDWVSGAALMIRRSLVDTIGPLDEHMFGEDMDWCFRARQMGARVYHMGSAKIIHYWGAASSVPEKAAGRVFVSRQSKAYYALKHQGKVAFLLMVIAVICEALIKMPLLSARVRWGRDPDACRRYAGQRVGYGRLLRAIAARTLLSADQSWWTHSNN